MFSGIDPTREIQFRWGNIESWCGKIRAEVMVSVSEEPNYESKSSDRKPSQDKPCGMVSDLEEFIVIWLRSL